MTKKLEEKSQFNDLDVDGDGTVSDHELSIVQAHDAHRKYKTQERITIGTAVSMLVFIFLGLESYRPSLDFKLWEPENE